jgi:hypothetical protein
MSNEEQFNRCVLSLVFIALRQRHVTEYDSTMSSEKQVHRYHRNFIAIRQQLVLVLLSVSKAINPFGTATSQSGDGCGCREKCKYEVVLLMVLVWGAGHYKVRMYEVL